MAAAPVESCRPRSNGRPAEPQRALFKGDDAVPRGLAVASAITLRVGIVVGGLVLVALGASRLQRRLGRCAGERQRRLGREVGVPSAVQTRFSGGGRGR